MEMEDFNDGLDAKLACRMRLVNAEQFHTLVRMHLSFELHLNTNTEESDPVTEKAKLKKWGILNFSKKPKPTVTVQKGVEGAALTKEGINQVKQLVDYLSQEECITQEGIFRRTGKLTRQQELKIALYQGSSLNLDEGRYSVHDCASVLKGFLADLPEPLLTELHYPAHCQIAELCTSKANESKLLRSLQLILLLLPMPNRIILKDILGLLNKTAANENSNKMNCDTLATLFTPHLLCPRKLSPEALHINSQMLSGLVAFMIKKGIELFQIPPKLCTDIRAFWVKQEKKLLSQEEPDVNESTTDTHNTAHTVFSFVDRNLTAKASATQDTQAALAQLYAHIQSMPESAKKRQLVKQFNKQNGHGTPRHIKINATSNSGSKSFGDSIKKKIFQKKLLNHKKMNDSKYGSNISRSSSEENILSNTMESPGLLPTMFSKSEDELSDTESYEVLKGEPNLIKVKHISNSTGSLNTPFLTSYKKKSKIVLKNFLNLSERSISCSPKESKNKSSKKKAADQELSRHRSEPFNMCSSKQSTKESEMFRQLSDPSLLSTIRLSTESPKSSPPESNEPSAMVLSPATKNKLRSIYAAHTSTPSNLLRKSLTVGDCVLTPISDDEKSMSPITQSTSKMTKAMQETMMTPRSRKPVIMISASNLCSGLNQLENDKLPCNSTNGLQTPSLNINNRNNYPSIAEETPELAANLSAEKTNSLGNKENITRSTPDDQNYVTCLEDVYSSTFQKSTTVSALNPFKEYVLSRSVLTASPVDLSFTSRTGDYEQSESDLNVLIEVTNTESDTSGIVSGGTNSVNNSAEKVEDTITPRKRSTSLQRNDSKRSIKDESVCDKLKTDNMSKQKQMTESELIDIKIKDPLPETSF